MTAILKICRRVACCIRGFVINNQQKYQALVACPGERHGACCSVVVRFFNRYPHCTSRRGFRVILEYDGIVTRQQRLVLVLASVVGLQWGLDTMSGQRYKPNRRGCAKKCWFDTFSRFHIVLLQHL